MHEFLRSIGFKSFRTKKQLNELTDWVLEKPDQLSVVSVNAEQNLAVAEREIAGHAGISVVGEIDERGVLVPEYYFPFISSTFISSNAQLSYEKQAAKDSYIGMCEDYRMGMALIFTIRNLVDIVRNETGGILGKPFTEVALSMLCSDGTVLLPILETEKVLDTRDGGTELERRLLTDDSHGDPDALDKLTRQEMMRYKNVMDHLHDTDIYTMVNSFFMPHGMESDRYYLMGDIEAVQLFENPMTKEHFYRMKIRANGMEMVLAINQTDLLGIPSPGHRIKCHGWLLGDMKKHA